MLRPELPRRGARTQNVRPGVVPVDLRQRGGFHAFGRMPAPQVILDRLPRDELLKVAVRQRALVVGGRSKGFAILHINVCRVRFGLEMRRDCIGANDLLIGWIAIAARPVIDGLVEKTERIIGSRAEKWQPVIGQQASMKPEPTT